MELEVTGILAQKKNEPASKPFRVFYKDTTVPNYAKSWARMICMCIRSRDMDDHGIELTEKQLQLVWEIRQLLEFDVVNELQLDGLVLELSTALIQHSDWEDQKSALLYYLGLLGWDKVRGIWLIPNDYTPHLAAIQCCMRLLGLEIAIPLHLRSSYKEHFID